MFGISKRISRTYLGILQNNGSKMNNDYSKTSSSDKKQFYVRWFKELDSDHDGYITKEELMRGLKNIRGISDGQEGEDDAMRKIDVHKFDLTSYEEFMTFVSGQPDLELREKSVAKTFQVFDNDGDGRINRAELVATFSYIGQELQDAHAEQVVKEFDRDGDGLITFDEFKLFLFSKDNNKK